MKLDKLLHAHKINDYLHHLRNNKFPDGYLEHHKHGIQCLEWLQASYEGRAGSPKVLLEAMINKLPYNDGDDRWIMMLYNWVTYKKIVGF